MPPWSKEESGEILSTTTYRESLAGDTLGTIVHRVCEFGPFDSASERDTVIRRVTNGLGVETSKDQQEFIRQHVERALDCQQSLFDYLTEVSIRRELPVRLQVAETTIVGEIDLLVITEDSYHILDYKTNRVNDRKTDLQHLCEHYRPQLEVYAAALQRADPDRSVTATLYFTEADAPRQLTFAPDQPPTAMLEHYVDEIVE